MTQSYDQIPETALDWHRRGKGAVLATVVQTWGSAPRPVGSQMVISGGGDMAGSVSGGCVEGAVVTEALGALETGRAELLEFGVADADAFAVGLACGGSIRILVEPVGQVMPLTLLETLVDARAARAPVAYGVDIQAGARRVVPGDAAGLAARFRGDKSGFEGDEFIAIHNPPLRLIVVGAVHVAQALLPMARLAGYAPVLIDPRPAFAAAARFPGEDIVEDWPDAGLSAARPDARTAIVTLTHDPKLDDPAIVAGLASPAFYIGCLGSVRTHAKRLERLTAAGVAQDQLARIHGPVGLDIGSQGPSEIALSILAQMTAVLRRGVA